jgi:2-polyprenyl-3-methyl-5-hydroxy-6-metoxy-1,4-benzoquinol methylase
MVTLERPPSALCPLCRAHNATPVYQIAFEDIWAALDRGWGVLLSDDVRQRHTPAPVTELNRCLSCHLEFFYPVSEGDASFYAELMATLPYEEDRMEFQAVAPWLQSKDAVADLGCGSGAFLRQIRASVARAVGVDHNRAAIDELRATGIEAYAATLADFSGEHPAAFDVVTAFQILEHVGDVATVLGPAIECLRPGGALFISVPNRMRRTYGLEPLDCPPHHLSRWAAPQFQVLATRFQLQLLEVLFEEPDYSHATIIEGERRLGAVGRRWPRLAARLGRAVLSVDRYEEAAASRRYSSRGAPGHTMTARLLKPARPNDPSAAAVG